jgi:hypothetical protein
MKIGTEGLADAKAITEPVEDKAGIEYVTVETLQGVVQLDRLNDLNAVAIVRTTDDREDLRTIPLP